MQSDATTVDAYLDELLARYERARS